LHSAASLTTQANIRITDPDLRAAAYADLLLLAYSHASVHGFMLWGFWADSVYRPDSELVNSNWTLNAAGQRFFSQIEAWKTKAMLVSDALGLASIRATYGSYVVQALSTDGGVSEYAFDFQPQTPGSPPREINLIFDAAPRWTKPAEFSVSAAVVTPNPGAFSAVMYDGPTNNWLNGGAYEPFSFRNKFFATETSPSNISTDQSSIDGYNTWKEGLMDGATARIYRVVNGSFTLVRTDTVIPGGYRASGWNRANAISTLVAPSVNIFYEFFDAWWRTGAPYYYAVRAVDTNGVRGYESNAVSLNRTTVTGSPPGLNNTQTASNPSSPKPLPSGTVRLASPGNFRLVSVNTTTGMVTFAWDGITAASLLGYEVIRSDYPPEQQRGYGIDLSTAPSDPYFFVQVNP
jgi:hypothetical protein